MLTLKKMLDKKNMKIIEQQGQIAEFHADQHQARMQLREAMKSQDKLVATYKAGLAEQRAIVQRLDEEKKEVEAEKNLYYSELRTTEKQKRKSHQVTDHPVTMKGKIDQYDLEIRGVIPRGGLRSRDNKSGPCMFCSRMF